MSQNHSRSTNMMGTNLPQLEINLLSNCNSIYDKLIVLLTIIHFLGRKQVVEFEFAIINPVKPPLFSKITYIVHFLYKLCYTHINVSHYPNPMRSICDKLIFKRKMRRGVSAKRFTTVSRSRRSSICALTLRTPISERRLLPIFELRNVFIRFMEHRFIVVKLLLNGDCKGLAPSSAGPAMAGPVHTGSHIKQMVCTFLAGPVVWLQLVWPAPMRRPWIVMCVHGKH